jgi:hypothetical protein
MNIPVISQKQALALNTYNANNDLMIRGTLKYTGKDIQQKWIRDGIVTVEGLGAKKVVKFNEDKRKQLEMVNFMLSSLNQLQFWIKR